MYKRQPYNKGLVQKVLPLLESRVSENALIACETAANEELPESIGSLSVIPVSYTHLDVYKRQPS